MWLLFLSERHMVETDKTDLTMMRKGGCGLVTSKVQYIVCCDKSATDHNINN